MLRPFLRVFMASSLVTGSAATAQSAIQLEPLSDPFNPSKRTVDVTTVHNYYGQCGRSIVQVLGVVDQSETSFTTDVSATDQASIVVIAPGGRRHLILRNMLSDYNGVACVTKSGAKLLLIWSNCGGTACPDAFNFTVVDVRGLRVIAGGLASCDAQCATRLTGSRLPFVLNHH